MSKKAFITSIMDGAGKHHIRIGNLHLSDNGDGNVVAGFSPTTSKKKTVELGIEEFSFLSRLALLCLQEPSEAVLLDQAVRTWLEGYVGGMSLVQIPNFQPRSPNTQNPPKPQSHNQGL